MHRILLIDDDAPLGAPLATYFQRFELELVHALRPSDGLAQLTAGGFDAAILDVMLPTLRAERAATYSPVMPISAKSGVVLQVPVEVVDAEAGIVRFVDEGETIEQSILGGAAKLQWKVDWAMRWVALGVDYEMYGQDLTASGVQSGKIARVLGGQKPEGLIYEMYLDAQGETTAKSKSHGLSAAQWHA